MRRLGNDPGPSFNLAPNWARWGRPGPAGVGAVVVWAHQVGKIVDRENGQWLVESGNDGHAVRTRPRSIAGAIPSANLKKGPPGRRAARLRIPLTVKRDLAGTVFYACGLR